MDSTNKLAKWSFIFCNFYTAADRGAFKRKMKKAGLGMSLLNSHNLIITGANGGARAFILANIPDRTTLLNCFNIKFPGNNAIYEPIFEYENVSYCI